MNHCGAISARSRLRVGGSKLDEDLPLRPAPRDAEARSLTVCDQVQNSRWAYRPWRSPSISDELRKPASGIDSQSRDSKARHELERQLSRVDTCIALSAKQHRDLFRRVRTLGIFNESAEPPWSFAVSSISEP